MVPPAGTALNPVDKLLAVYLGSVTLIIAARGGVGTATVWLIIAHLLFGVLLYLFTRLTPRDTIGAVLHDLYPLFLLMAFVAMFSTTYAVMDGMPRTLVAAVRHIRNEPDPERNQGGPVFWAFLFVVIPVSLAVVSAVPNPAVLFLVVGTLNFLFNPIYYILNTWCVTNLIKDQHMRPSRGALWIARLGIVFMLGTAALLIYTQIFVRMLGAEN